MAQPQLESTEAELIKRVCGGEPQAFEDLLRPYERLVYATAISILRNPADAEEVAQEAVLKAFSKLSSFRGESRFSTWLVQITYNEARMKLRKERQHLYESIGRGTLRIGAQFLPSCSKKKSFARPCRTESILSARCIGRS